MHADEVRVDGRGRNGQRRRSAGLSSRRLRRMRLWRWWPGNMAWTPTRCSIGGSCTVPELWL